MASIEMNASPAGYAAMPDSEAAQPPPAEADGVSRGWTVGAAAAGAVAAGAVVALLILALNPSKPSPPERPKWWK